MSKIPFYGSSSPLSMTLHVPDVNAELLLRNMGHITDFTMKVAELCYLKGHGLGLGNEEDFSDFDLAVEKSLFSCGGNTQETSDFDRFLTGELDNDSIDIMLDTYMANNPYHGHPKFIINREAETFFYKHPLFDKTSQFFSGALIGSLSGYDVIVKSYVPSGYMAFIDFGSGVDKPLCMMVDEWNPILHYQQNNGLGSPPEIIKNFRYDIWAVNRHKWVCLEYGVEKDEDYCYISTY